MKKHEDGWTGGSLDLRAALLWAQSQGQLTALARMAKLSRDTLYRGLRRPESLTIGTAQEIVAAARALGYGHHD